MNLLRTSVLLGLLALAACDEQKPNSTTTSASSATPAAATTSAVPAAATTSAAPAAAAAAAKETAPTGTPVTFAEAATYDIDPTHTAAGFSVRHMMISNVKGQFEKVSGKLHVEEDISKITLNVEIDAASITTRNADRDKHLKSPDFFDTAKYPKLTFKSTKVERAGAGFKVTGDLTIKDVTKSVVLTVDSVTPETKDPFAGALHRGAHAVGTINRTDYGLKWNKALETGGAMVGEEVTLELDAEFVRKK